MESSNLRDQIEEIRKALWAKRPIMGEILDTHGNESLYKYSQDFLNVNPTPYLDKRKEELYTVVNDLLKVRLGETVANNVCEQLRYKPLISTADHHGVIDNPYWVNSNIIDTLPIPESGDTKLKHSIVFSFASISVNNASAYPRGILFHGGMPDKEEMIRLPFLPDRNKMSVVYNMRGYTKEDIEKAKQQLTQKVKSQEVTAERAEKIKNIIETFCETEEILNTPTLVEQITKINYRLWPHLFHGTNGTSEASDFKVDLVYLEIETIVTELLLKRHLSDSSSLIYRLLFEEKFQKAGAEYFNNLAGSFSTDGNWGTHFFWAVDEKLYRVGLQFDGKNIFSVEQNISIPFTPEGITQALREKKIFPNMFLCYLMIAFYYGMKCTGGFSQVNDLTMLKIHWQKMLRELGENEEADAIEPVQTKDLNAGGVVLAYNETESGKLYASTGIDMILDPRDTRFEHFIEFSKRATLFELMVVMFPTTYSVLYSAPERNETLASLSPAEILKETGVETKLRDCLENIR